VRFPAGYLPDIGLVDFELPGTRAIKMTMVRMPWQSSKHEVASLQAVKDDWAAIETMSLWLFHTPAGAVPSLPPGVPAIASTTLR
jgi:cellulose synthase (UDP-forming)